MIFLKSFLFPKTLTFCFNRSAFEIITLLFFRKIISLIFCSVFFFISVTHPRTLTRSLSLTHTHTHTHTYTHIHTHTHTYTHTHTNTHIQTDARLVDVIGVPRVVSNKRRLKMFVICTEITFFLISIEK